MIQYPKPITDVYLKEIEIAKQPDEETVTSEEQASQQTDEIITKQTGGSVDQSDTSDVPMRFLKRRDCIGREKPVRYRTRDSIQRR